MGEPDPAVPRNRKSPIERATLDPSCMNVILTYQNGVVDEWAIPGLVDEPQSSLATSSGNLTYYSILFTFINPLFYA